MATDAVDLLPVDPHGLILMQLLVPNVDFSMGRYAQMGPAKLDQLQKVTSLPDESVLPERLSWAQVEILSDPSGLAQRKSAVQKLACHVPVLLHQLIQRRAMKPARALPRATNRPLEIVDQIAAEVELEALVHVVIEPCCASPRSYVRSH